MKNPDILQRFLFDGTDVRGEITTLSSSYQDIIALHDYPQTISKLFGEFLVAASLIGASLKQSGMVTVQATGDGPVSTIMAECSQGQKLRGIVRGDWDSSESSTLSDSANLADVMGSGTLAITIEPDQ